MSDGAKRKPHSSAAPVSRSRKRPKPPAPSAYEDALDDSTDVRAKGVRAKGVRAKGVRAPVSRQNRTLAVSRGSEIDEPQSDGQSCGSGSDDGAASDDDPEIAAPTARPAAPSGTRGSAPARRRSFRASFSAASAPTSDASGAAGGAGVGRVHFEPGDRLLFVHYGCNRLFEASVTDVERRTVILSVDVPIYGPLTFAARSVESTQSREEMLKFASSRSAKTVAADQPAPENPDPRPQDPPKLARAKPGPSDAIASSATVCAASAVAGKEGAHASCGGVAGKEGAHASGGGVAGKEGAHASGGGVAGKERVEASRVGGNEAVEAAGGVEAASAWGKEAVEASGGVEAASAGGKERAAGRSRRWRSFSVRVDATRHMVDFELLSLFRPAVAQTGCPPGEYFNWHHPDLWLQVGDEILLSKQGGPVVRTKASDCYDPQSFAARVTSVNALTCHVVPSHHNKQNNQPANPQAKPRIVAQHHDPNKDQKIERGGTNNADVAAGSDATLNLAAGWIGLGAVESGSGERAEWVPRNTLRFRGFVKRSTLKASSLPFVMTPSTVSQH